MKPTKNFIKQSQFDASSLLSGLRDAGAAAGSGVSNWYSSLDPEVKNTVTRGLLGAGAGATALGLTHALTAEDPTDIKRKAMLGALLGGAGAAALPAGFNMIRGNITMPGEPELGPIDRINTEIATTIGENPWTIGGGVAGGVLGRKVLGLQGLLGLDLTGPSADKLIEENRRAGVRDPDIPKINNMSPAERRAAMEKLRGVTYTDLSESVDIPQRIPSVGGKSIRVPRTAAFNSIQALKQTSKDPRVKLLASILAGVGTGAVLQQGTEGPV